MLNASDKGFELAILSDVVMKELLETINDCKEENRDIYMVWQMKFKHENFILYKNCRFSDPIDNYHPSDSTKLFGQKLKVTCDGAGFYSESRIYKDREVRMTDSKYKDANLLTRMLKIGELNLLSE